MLMRLLANPQLLMASGVRLQKAKQEQGGAPAPSRLVGLSPGTGSMHDHLASRLALKLFLAGFQDPTEEAEGVKARRGILQCSV